MDASELARTVAADLGGDIASETERELRGEPPDGGRTKALGIPEAMAIAGFLVSCAQLAFTIWQARQDRAILMQALLEQAPNLPLPDPDRRLGLLGLLVDRLVPDSFGVSPSLGAQTTHTKQEWMKQWLGLGTKAIGPAVLQPFAEMDNFIVYQPITWVPPDKAPPDLPRSVKVPKGFVTDLATIPRFFWWVLPPQGNYGHAAILHDWLYWDRKTTREVADRVFDVAMDEMAVAPPVRKAMWAAVRLYGGRYWDEAAREKARGVNRVLIKFPESAIVPWKDWRQRPDVFDTLA